LEDTHKAALDALTHESLVQLNKISDELTTMSAAKADLDQQVTKLTEDLAGSTKEVAALKEEVQKAESALKE
jgi:archaellum component FlaC